MKQGVGSDKADHNPGSEPREMSRGFDTVDHVPEREVGTPCTGTLGTRDTPQQFPQLSLQKKA
jgi:hypothetical protein